VDRPGQVVGLTEEEARLASSANVSSILKIAVPVASVIAGCELFPEPPEPPAPAPSPGGAGGVPAAGNAGAGMSGAGGGGAAQDAGRFASGGSGLFGSGGVGRGGSSGTSTRGSGGTGTSGSGGVTDSGAFGRGGAGIVPGDAGCTWAGSRCQAGEARVCHAGRLVSVQSCQRLGCKDEFTCMAPGSPSAVATVSGGLTPTTTCSVFQNLGCGACLNTQCCTSAQSCARDSRCASLWQCLQACTSLACENDCAARFPTSVQQVADIITCAQARCSVQCNGDACRTYPFTGWGYGCGANLAPGADPNALYLCLNQTTQGAVRCPNGCRAGATGEPDYCIGNDPCLNSPYDGFACGSNLATPSASPNVMYECRAQRTVSTRNCVVCIKAPPGEADECL
jgi:hypothetical protein